MDFKELLEKYRALQLENNRLKEEIRSLSTQLGGGELINNHIEVLSQAMEPTPGFSSIIR